MSNLNNSRRLLQETWNDRNFAVIDELLAEDFVSHDRLAGDLHGPLSQHQFIQGMISAFPDVHVVILAQYESAGLIVSKVVFRGTNRGSLRTPDGQEYPATNRVAEVPVTIRDRYSEDGLIVESWSHWDPEDMLAQLGY